MNILHIVLALRTGGLERVVLDLIKHSSLPIKNFVCCLDEIGDHANELEAMCVPYFELGNYGNKKIQTLSRIRKIIKEHKIDVIHTHNPSPHFYGCITGLLTRIPVVHTKHGRNYPDKRWEVLKNYFFALLSYRIVCVSSDSANVALNIENIPSQKIVTILNGIDIHKYSKNTQPLTLKEMGINHSCTIVGIVARLSAEKDHGTLLHAMSIITKTEKNIALLIIGDGPLRTSLETMAKDLHITQHCFFLGNRKDIPDLLATMDIFVLCSTTEGISLTLLEAMAASLPIVCTNVGGNPEVVLHNSTGFIVPSQNPQALADGILKLVASPQKRREMGEEGLKRVINKFSIADVTRRYEELYLSATNR